MWASQVTEYKREGVRTAVEEYLGHKGVDYQGNVKIQ